MQIESVELHSLEAARSLGYITQGTPLYRFEIKEGTQTLTAYIIAYASHTARLKVFESKRWLAAKNLNDLSAICSGFSYRTQYSDLCPAGSRCFVWNLPYFETEHELYLSAKKILLALISAYQRENTKPLDVPVTRIVLFASMPCTLAPEFAEELSALLYRFAESYDVTIPYTYKETPDGKE